MKVKTKIWLPAALSLAVVVGIAAGVIWQTTVHPASADWEPDAQYCDFWPGSTDCMEFRIGELENQLAVLQTELAAVEAKNVDQDNVDAGINEDVANLAATLNHVTVTLENRLAAVEAKNVDQDNADAWINEDVANLAIKLNYVTMNVDSTIDSTIASSLAPYPLPDDLHIAVKITNAVNQDIQSQVDALTCELNDADIIDLDAWYATWPDAYRRMYNADGRYPYELSCGPLGTH